MKSGRDLMSVGLPFHSKYSAKCKNSAEANVFLSEITSDVSRSVDANTVPPSL